MPTELRARPLPDCAAPAPALADCPWCEGGFVPDDDLGGVPCGACGGSGKGHGYGACEFRLNRSRTHSHRRCQFDPGTGRLRLTQGRRFTDYDVREIPHDEGRGFELAKVDGGEIHHVGVSRAGVTCDCPGFVYLAAARANQIAHEAGEDVYATFGCKHADCLVPLYRAGWFDLGHDRTPDGVEASEG